MNFTKEYLLLAMFFISNNIYAQNNQGNQNNWASQTQIIEQPKECQLHYGEGPVGVEVPYKTKFVIYTNKLSVCQMKVYAEVGRLKKKCTLSQESYKLETLATFGGSQVVLKLSESCGPPLETLEASDASTNEEVSCSLHSRKDYYGSVAAAQTYSPISNAVLKSKCKQDAKSAIEELKKECKRAQESYKLTYSLRHNMSVVTRDSMNCSRKRGGGGGGAYGGRGNSHQELFNNLNLQKKRIDIPPKGSQ